LWTTFLIAIVIGFGLALYFKSNYKKREIVHVKNIIAKEGTGVSIQIWSENRKESFTVDLDKLLFIEKKDNYVLIYYQHKKLVEKQLIRASLKDIEEKYLKLPLTRCHLSYIVNLNKVIDYTGNSKGLKLSMSNLDRAVPVSSKYCQKIIAELSNISLSAPIAT
jgi:DNA-binding LytR/AlgR family response regulator